MAELVDALASGASGRKVVEVRVFSWAPLSNIIFLVVDTEKAQIHVITEDKRFLSLCMMHPKIQWLKLFEHAIISGIEAANKKAVKMKRYNFYILKCRIFSYD